MTIYRTEHNKENPYFMLNRAGVNDDKLSFKAVGILTYLLSKPDKWEVHENDLVNRHTEGACAVRTGLKELAEAGYFVKIQVRNEKNQIVGWITEVHEIPIEQAKGEKDKFFHIAENPHSGNCTNRKTADIVSNDSLGSKERKKSSDDPLPSTSDRDGKYLLELLRAAGFMYLDSQPTKIAMQLESDYTDGQLRTALTKTVDAHQKQIKTGKRGITAPMAYMASVLRGMDDDAAAVSDKAADANVINLAYLLENAQ